MKKRIVVPYNPSLKVLAKELRNNSTKAEVTLWQKIKRKQMHGYDFHRQKPIDNFILDFYCSELNLGIEVDGYSHEFLEVQQKDTIKSNKLRQLGITILRFSDHEVFKDMENVLRAIEIHIENFENGSDLN